MQKIKFFLVSILAVVLLFLVGCQKNELDSLSNQVEQATEKVTLEETPNGVSDAEDISAVLSVDLKSAQSRGTNVLIYNATADVQSKGWKLYKYPQTSLAKGYKYTAVITPLSGDPDLYIYGFDAEKTSPWRKLSQSTSTTVEIGTLQRYELTADEESGYFAIYGYSNAKFNIQVYREDVCGTEDCLNFNPKNVRLFREGTQYVITDGISRMETAPNLAEAVQIVRTIKTYKMDSHCFVGRPDASFEHYTVNGSAPVGAISGEDCVGFNPATIEVKEVNERWKIVDGDHWIFDFDKSKEEAQEAYCLIKRYGYTKSCFVGRPNPSFQYMRR